MTIKFRSTYKRTSGNVMYFTQRSDGRVMRRTPRYKYMATRWKNLNEAKAWMELHGYKEVKQYKKLTEIQWLDKVCENFKGPDNDF